jgi:hypothetical protein
MAIIDKQSVFAIWLMMKFEARRCGKVSAAMGSQPPERIFEKLPPEGEYTFKLPSDERKGMSDVILIPREGGVIRSRFRGSAKKFQAFEMGTGR